MPDIDVVDPGRYEVDGIPHDQFTWLRANAPVFWHPGDDQRDWPGFWAITRHEDVVHVSRHPELFSSYQRLALFPEPDDEQLLMQRMMMLNQDPPEHTRKRSIVNKGFTPRSMAKLESHIRQICVELIDEVAPRGEADFVRDIAAPLPLYVICELLGAPAGDRQMLFDLSNKLVGGDDPEFQSTPEDGLHAATDLYVYANELAEQRRAQARDDIVTKLLQPDENGQELTVEEFDLFVMLLTVAGNETTRNASSGGMLAFFEHPAQWQRLLTDRRAGDAPDGHDLFRTTPDEIVRWVNPVNLFRRTATEDTELRGQRIRKGDKVVVFYAAANHDETVFKDPYTFDIGRDPNPQIGFGGGGPHFCLGNHLARLELRVLFETLVDRMPDIAPAGPVRRLRSNFLNGIKEMPVRFTATGA